MNPLERLMYVSGDKPPKKMPTRQPMWNQGYTEPSVNTATPRLPVSRPTTYDDYNPQAYKYFGTNGAIKTDWSRENDVRYNAKVDNELKARYDNQGLAQLGKFAASVISDPLALGVSAYDYIQDPSWANAGALGLDTFTPGNVGGFLKGMAEAGTIGLAAREFSRDKNVVSKILRGGSIDPKDLPSVRTQIRILSNKSLNPLVPTSLDDIPQIIPNRSNIMEFLKAQNAQKQAVTDFFEAKRTGYFNLPMVDNASLAGYGPYERGAILEYYTPDVNRAIDEWGETLRNSGVPVDEKPLFRKEQTNRLYREILGKTPNQALNANLSNIPYPIREYIEKMDDKIYNNTPNRFTVPPSPQSSVIPIPHEQELVEFGQMYSDAFNEHLAKRGMNNLSVKTSPARNALIVELSDESGNYVGDWTIGLNSQAMEKIAKKDWSLPEFPHNAIDPYDEIPVQTMVNTSGANLPPKAGLYSQEFMDAWRDKTGIRTGAGRNSQSVTKNFPEGSGKIGSEDIWKGKVDKGKAWVSNYGVAEGWPVQYTKAISYGLLPPLLYKVMQREENRRER